MRTRMLMAAAAAVMLSAATSASAGERIVLGASDGCTALAEIVYTEVTAANWRFFRGGLQPRYVDNAERTICRHTARTVTLAFSRAMADMNVYFQWTTPERRRGDVCDSVDLSQCYPDRNPDMPSFSFSEAAFVMNVWSAVRLTVLLTMQPGAANDVSRFSVSAVTAQMNERLDQAARNRWRPDRAFDESHDR